MNIMNLPDDTLRYIFSYVKSQDIMEKLLVSKRIANLFEELHESDYALFFKSLKGQSISARAIREIYTEHASHGSISSRDLIVALFRKQFSYMNHFSTKDSYLNFIEPKCNLKAILKAYKKNEEQLDRPIEPKGNLEAILKAYKKNEKQLDRPIATSLNIMLNLIYKDRSSQYSEEDYKKLTSSEKREVQESYFEENLEKLRTLKVLDYSKAGPAASSICAGLPPHVSFLTNLEKVNLSGHKVSNYPNQLLALHSIKKINLATTYFASFPKQLLKLKELETIRISNNYISEIPPEISQLQKLKKLYLTKTLLSTLPKELFRLPCLNKIFLMENKVLQNKEVMKQLKEHIWLNRNISIFPALLDEQSLFRVFPTEIILKIFRSKCAIETAGSMTGVREV